MKRPLLRRILTVILLTFAAAGELFAATKTRPSSGGSCGLAGVLVVGIFVLIGALIGFILYLDRKRSQKIQAIATGLGFTFRRKPVEADKGLIAGCSLANAGHGRVMSNILEAAQTADLNITLFDYSYTVGYGKSSQVYQQTITRMQTPMLNLPAFALYPETIFSKLGKLFGGADINFPDAPEFSKKFILRGPDEAAIRALFTPAVRRFFEQQPALTIDAAGDLLFAHRSGRRAKPEQIESYVAEGKKIIALFFEAGNAAPPAMPPAMPPPLPPQ